MNAFSALGHELLDRRVRTGRLEQFDTALARVQHRHSNALLIDLIVTADVQPQRTFINFDSFGKRLHSDADMIDLHLNLKFRMISSTTEYGSCCRLAI